MANTTQLQSDASQTTTPKPTQKAQQVVEIKQPTQPPQVNTDIEPQPMEPKPQAEVPQTHAQPLVNEEAVQQDAMQKEMDAQKMTDELANGTVVPASTYDETVVSLFDCEGCDYGNVGEPSGTALCKKCKLVDAPMEEAGEELDLTIDIENGLPETASETAKLVAKPATQGVVTENFMNITFGSMWWFWIFVIVMLYLFKKPLMKMLKIK